MKKATAKTAPPSLGTKRNCPKCALKFYDLGRATIQCPKCGAEVDPDAELQLFRQPAESKKAKSKLRDDDEEVVTTASSEDSFEDVDDLGDDDESLEDLAAEEDREDET